jgi:PAS domain S-box-containing protein
MIKKWFGIGDKKAEAAKSKAMNDKMSLANQALKDAAVGTMTLAQDVTEVLQARIDEYAKQIQNTANMISDALMLVRADGTIESFNHGAELIFGYTKGYIIGRHIRELFQFDDLNRNFEISDQFVLDVNHDKSGRTIQYEDFMGVTRDGRHLFIDVSATRQKRNDGRVHYLLLVRDVTKRVEDARQFEALADYNERLLTAVNSSQIGIVITDAKEDNFSDYRVIFANTGFTTLSGYSREDLLGQNMRHLLGSESVSENYWLLRRAMSSGRSASAEICLYDKMDNKFWVDIQLTPVYRDGVVKNWIIVFHDLTELKATYEILRKSEQHFRAFGETTSEAMFIHSHDTILDWNRNLSSLTGYSESEIGIMSPLDFLHPLERESVMTIISEQESREYETLYMTKTGDVKEIAVKSQVIEWESDSARIAVVRDITSYKDVEEMLRCSRERYRTIVDNTIDLVCCFDSDFRITFVNYTFRDYFNIEEKTAEGLNLLEFMPEKDGEAFRRYIASISMVEPVKRAIHRVKHEEGIRFMDWIDRAIYDDAGNFIEYQSVGRDVTSLVNKED